MMRQKRKSELKNSGHQVAPDGSPKKLQLEHSEAPFSNFVTVRVAVDVLWTNAVDVDVG
jgi:hypothetical protein